MGSTNDREGVRVADLVVKLNLGTEKPEIGNTSFGDQIPPLDLSHELTLLASSHPANEVLALEGIAGVSLLGERDVAGTGLIDGKLELRHLWEFAGETS